jgi:hypothetical protein
VQWCTTAVGTDDAGKNPSGEPDSGRDDATQFNASLRGVGWR